MNSFSEEPRRPKSHQIGDKAKNQIMELFSSQGWIVDPVISDYGDDIHIQITEGENLIPVRIYAQIKGTNNIQQFQKGDSYKIPNLKRSTVIHWMNSDEPTILILWDVKTKSGFYGFVDDVFYNFDLDKEKNKNVTAVLSNELLLNKESIHSFKIMAISNSCDRRFKTLLGMESMIKHHKDAEEIYGIQKNTIRSQMTDNVLFYLTSIGILEMNKRNGKFGMSNEFHEYFISEFAQQLAEKKIIKRLTEKNLDKLFGTSLILSLVKWRQIKFNHASPSALLEGCFRLIPAYYKNALAEVKQMLKNQKE